MLFFAAITGKITTNLTDVTNVVAELCYKIF